MAEEHPLKPFYSVLVLAFACSALVAAAAVGLRPYQEVNRSLDQKRNILKAAGIYREEVPIAQQFDVIKTRLIDLEAGRFVDEGSIDPASYHQLAAALSDDTGQALDPQIDLAGIRRLEKYSLAYLVMHNGKVEELVLPVRGKGLWSTMYAYVAIDADLSTVRGVSFYEHGETPGLGGEIENPRWQSRWQKKELYDPAGDLAFGVVKSGTLIAEKDEKYRVDGLSGATLTTKGVDHLMKFWFGEHGFKPFFDHIKQQGGFNG